MTFSTEHPLAITGRIFRTARLRDEPYQCVEDPKLVIEKIKGARSSVDVFTFMQEISEITPKYRFHLEWDSLAVLPVTTYDAWLRTQIDPKARNKIRKAQKKGIELRLIPFDDYLVKAIMEIYNESPVRQGKPFLHYGKDFATLKKDHETFLEQSDFIGAFYKEEMIGFIKLFHGKNVASLMQVISKISHRDKAPTNALIASAVEKCATRNIPYLHYGIWSRRGLGTFKVSHGFELRRVPRYFIPLSLKGQLLLKLHLHRDLRDYVPERWLDRMASLRSKWVVLGNRTVSVDDAISGQ